MEKKNRKPGFSNRNPYDLSQSGLSIRSQRIDKGQRQRIDVEQSSYNMSQTPHDDAIKRIKLRSA